MTATKEAVQYVNLNVGFVVSPEHSAEQYVYEEVIGPTGSLRLTYYPMPGSMHVYCNGVEQRENYDWAYDGDYHVLLLPPMQALSADLIECMYAQYGLAPVAPDPAPVAFVDGNSTDLEYDYRYHFVLPTGVQTGDLMLIHWDNWHGWPISSQWTTIYNLSSSGNHVTIYKFITSETAGTAIDPNGVNGEGFRAAGVMQIIRGVDQGSPIVAYGNNDTSTTVTATQSDQIAVHMVANMANGTCDDPTLSRGVETAHQYVGNMGVRASTETLTAGQSVTCSTGGTGFLSSTILRKSLA